MNKVYQWVTKTLKYTRSRYQIQRVLAIKSNEVLINFMSVNAEKYFEPQTPTNNIEFVRVHKRINTTVI